MVKCAFCDTPVPDDSRFCGRCGADVSDPGGGPRTTGAGPDLGVRLARVLGERYEVKELLGRGGMGAVFLAQDRTLERLVAVKVLPPELSHDQSFVRRFEREARTAAKLDHPNIVPIFEVETGKDVNYFIMKQVKGQSLETLLSGQVPLEDCQRIVWEAARALGHAHQRGVIHRDIKPANLMIDEDGRTMLTDFGISKAMQTATQVTGTGQIIGTPFYMSPEQAKGLEIDGRADQYSLAVVGYEMIAGRKPFSDDSLHTVIYKHVWEQPDPLETHRPDAPPALRAVIHRALAKDPKDRFATMEEFATAVWPEHPVKAPTPISGVPRLSSRASAEAPTEITGPTGVRTTPVRSRSPWPVAVGLAVLAMAGGGYWAWAQGLIRFAGSRTAGGPDTAAALTVTPAARDNGPAMRPESIQVTAPPETQTPAVDSTFPSPGTGEGSGVRAKLGAGRRGAVRAVRNPPPVSTPATDSNVSAVPATAQQGFITVNADPYGTVSIDGVDVGDTPVVRYGLTPGSHVIRITREGCRPIEVRMTITAGNVERLNRPLVCS